jgi:CRISPR-associated protein, Cmr5 family
MSERSLEQERAKHALEAVNSIRGESWAGKFRSYVERLPAAIVMNGLGQAMAGELAAAGRAGRWVMTKKPITSSTSWSRAGFARGESTQLRRI